MGRSRACAKAHSVSVSPVEKKSMPSAWKRYRGLATASNARKRPSRACSKPLTKRMFCIGCGYGPRQPFIVVSPWVSPWARQNFVDHSVTDQTSVIRFVEDNWLGGQRIGQGSFDGIANSITQMFNFSNFRNSGRLFLNPSTGAKE